MINPKFTVLRYVPYRLSIAGYAGWFGQKGLTVLHNRLKTYLSARSGRTVKFGLGLGD